ncbi:MAG TPA: hypothetical protein DCY14_02900 [Anaerolineae bacterium]|nr:hypothetical protein [Anaerolineae bacterium]HRJ54700.1 hypothetical protein [Anaerolineales bacterium]
MIISPGAGVRDGVKEKIEVFVGVFVLVGVDVLVGVFVDDGVAVGAPQDKNGLPKPWGLLELTRKKSV